MTHSPGPWTVEWTDSYSCGKVVESPGWNVRGPDFIVFHLPAAGRTREKGEADAHLIAAAPAWHDAFRTIVGEANFGEDDGAMELGERLLAIDNVARAALASVEE